MKRQPAWGAFLVLAGLSAIPAFGDDAATTLGDLRVFSDGYPRVLFFRNSEGMAYEGRPIEQFEAVIHPHVGIIGKIFDEEKRGLSRTNIAYFNRYKERNPLQVVLVHFNGAARDPRSAPATFSAAHWLHYGGCRVAEDLPADPKATTLVVENADLFKIASGKKAAMLMPDDLTICGLRPDGVPDWAVYEYAKVTALDRDAKRLTIERGVLGTRPLEWKAGRAYVATHVTGGLYPLEGPKQVLWSYNFSLDAPRDAQGRNLVDVLTDDLVEKLGPGGPAAHLDGVEFDMFPWQPPQRLPKHFENTGRGQDTDGDGRPDFGVRDGCNRFGLGAHEFLRRLRERLGPGRLIMADANRRANGILNGVESEGWPSPFDPEINLWSSGLNEHRFWSERGFAPRLSYIHYKYASRQEGGNERVSLPPSRSRLILAAAQMLGVAVTSANGPAPEPGEETGVFDELRMGTGWRFGWLGAPLEPPRMLGLEGRDILNGEGVSLPEAFRRRLSAKDAILEFPSGDPPAIQVRAAKAGQEDFSFTLAGSPVAGSDLLLAFRLKCDPLPGTPPDVARKLTVTGSPAPDPATAPTALDTWADSEWFKPTMYLRGLKPGAVDLVFRVEGAGRVWIAGFEARAGADAMAREFGNGLVLANPSLAPCAFDLERLYPGRKWRRLQGSPGQDPKTNDGQAVGATVTLEARDGLFLVKAK